MTDLRNNYINQLAKRKILILLDSFKMGGAERQSVNLASYLKQNFDYEIIFWTICDEGQIRDILKEEDISYNKINFSYIPSRKDFLIKTKRIVLSLNNLHVNAIYSFSINGNITVGASWKISNAKCFIWGLRNDGRLLTEDFYEKLSIRASSHIIANSWNGANNLIKKHPHARNKIKVIYNGVKLEKPLLTVGQWKEKIKIPDNAMVFIMVANFNSSKDHLTLLNAWKNTRNFLSSNGMEATLCLAGRFDNTFIQSKAFVDSNNLVNTVLFIENTNDISGLLSISDVAILCSNTEGFPNAIIEYMAAKLPIIATDLPGIREVFNNEPYEFLFKHQDFNELAEMMILLAKKSELRKEVGLNNYNIYRTQYTVEQFAANMIKSVRELNN